MKTETIAEPELIISSEAIDLELTGLLGEQPSDFLVLYFDGRKFENYGTPLDTPHNRVCRQGFVDRLNDSSKNSLWPEMFTEWKTEFFKQFGLKSGTIAKEWHPLASIKISRVCPGYSKYLHAAIGLLEDPRIAAKEWLVRKESGSFSAGVMAADGKIYSATATTAALAIVDAVLKLLKAAKSPC